MEMAVEEEVWVVGYGSLIHRPGFLYTDRVEGYIRCVGVLQCVGVLRVCWGCVQQQQQQQEQQSTAIICIEIATNQQPR